MNYLGVNQLYEELGLHDWLISKYLVRQTFHPKDRSQWINPSPAFYCPHFLNFQFPSSNQGIPETKLIGPFQDTPSQIKQLTTLTTAQQEHSTILASCHSPLQDSEHLLNGVTI